MRRRSVEAYPGKWKGILATGLAIAIIFAFRSADLEIPNPGTILALAIVYSSFVGGLAIGLGCAGLAFLAALIFIAFTGSNPMTGQTGSQFVQLAVLAFCLPMMALLVGRLRGQLLRVTRERETERSQRAAEIRYRQLVDSIKDYAILMLDPKGIVRSWNEGAERIKGYRPEEIIGRSFTVFYLPEDRKAGKAEHELQVAAEAGRYEDEGWRMRKDGSRFWANVVLTSLRDPLTHELQGFVKVTRDLTERKKAEENIRQKSIALEAANKELTPAGTSKSSRKSCCWI